LQLQTTLGTALIATKGYSAPEVEQAYTRARELCQQAEETPLLIRSLYGLFSFYTVRAELDIAYGFAKQLFSVVERETDSEFLIEAHRAVGTTSFYHSQFVDAQQHLEQVRTIYQPLQHRSHAFLFGQDPGMAGHAFLGLTRWLLGYPHQALQFANQAVAVAQESKHVFSSAYALNFLVWCHHLRRDIASVATQSEALVALSIEQGFILFQTFGTFLRGWALAQQGQREAGLDAMSQGLADLQRMHQLLWQPYCVGLLAEAYSRDHHQADRALGMIDDALATLERTGESWYTVELHRLKGEVLLRLHTDRRCEAEAVFQQALVLARQQQARSWEWRTAVSLGKLWRQQGKGEQARTLLAPIYDGFMEGLETYDLQQAKALLQQLAS
jgi:predicted ATPase